MNRRSVAVLMGGPDAEHDVSLASGARVADALERHGGWSVARHVVDRPDAAMLRDLDADVIFPVLHGPFGEGGPLQEALEASGVAYVGSGPEASRRGMNKLNAKRIADACGVPTPEAIDPALESPGRLEPPVVVKPVDDGSSVGVRLCSRAAEVDAACRELAGRRLMVERLVRGRELTVGVVCGEVLPIVEIVPAAGFYDYEAKYHRDDTRYEVDPALDPEHAEACRRYARAIWDAVGCRDLARVDFIVDADGPWFLEVNTMPGMTDHSLLPMAAARAGLPMPELCALLVEAAFARRQEIAVPATVESNVQPRR
ncbi:MAG: D-alanine--D-alanine ligase family protein [Phycisphaerales bacterium]|jgi:D-alanine-D-alanine ligase